MGSDLAAAGAVGAAVGGRGACGALKCELYVFHKETIGFLKAGELPGASGRESRRRLERSLACRGGRWAREGASGERGGASGELWERFGEL